jgi:phospholipase/lecithinase/hemolysin
VLGGTDFAFGGATAGMPGPLPNLLQQANLYLGPTGNVASPDALYVIEGSGNDARAALAAIAGARAWDQRSRRQSLRINGGLIRDHQVELRAAFGRLFVWGR